MEDIYKVAYGKGLTLTEWKEKFKNSEFTEIKNCKSLKLYNNEEITNIKTLIIKNEGRDRPKYYSCHGSSGPDGYSAYNVEGYELSDQFIRDFLSKKFSGIKVKNSDITIKNCENDGFPEAMDELREIANEKFDKNIEYKRYTYYLNGKKITYESEIKETTDSVSEYPFYSFYLFNNEDICYEYHYAPAIYG
jgi:hypothetical protein